MSLHSYFLFQAGLIPVVFLMTDPTSPEAPSWMQDIEKTKALLTHPSFYNNRFAARCAEVINRLLSPPAEVLSGLSQGQVPNQQQQQTPFYQSSQGLMPFPEQLFSDPTFGGSFFPSEQPMPSPAGMDFSEWVNFPAQE